MQLAPVSQQIWEMKYRLKTSDGRPVDRTIADTWRRVARALAQPEADPALWEERFFAAMEDFKFLPAGRILSGAGANRRVTLFNCFVMGDIPDDMAGIFEHLKQAALTMQQGGGIGYDFSTLRPKGAPVHGVGADASGPLSFMDVWDAMCRTIMSAGSRRGAMMAVLRCDHPDIEAFVEAKREPGRLRMFNLSVLVSDAFMQAVEDDAAWELGFGGVVYRSVRARALWERIMRATYAYAEPGVIFIDRINRLNNLAYCEQIHATNPCGEQPLPAYGTCLLGSVNLARLVEDPFAEEARIDEAALAGLVTTAVRMMDNVIEVSGYPLPEHEAEARAKRRIGLGITGLADALIMCAARYGSDRAVALTKAWMRTIQRSAYLASAALAAEKGAFPLYDRDAYLAGETIAGLDPDVRAAIADHGIRNALLTSVAPTGTISLFADNVSSGLEPVFSFNYVRHVLMPDGSRREEEVTDYAYRRFRRLAGEAAALPEAFVDTRDLSPRDHLLMQAAVQEYVDSSISKTINCPEEIAFDDFKEIYREAYALGCKGCTTYRPNEVTGAVLEVRPAEASPRRRPIRDRAGDRAGRTGGQGARGRPPARPRRRRHRPDVSPAGPAGGAARQDLQGQVAGERPRHLHHRQRHHPGRPQAPVRGVHQLQEHGALRLDGGADADDLGGVPPRRRRRLRRRGAEGGVRPPRRAVDGRPLRSEPARRHRRGHRAAHDRHRLPSARRRRRLGRRGPGGGPDRRRAASAGLAAGPGAGSGTVSPVPQVRRADPDPPGGLRHLRQLRLLQV